MSIKVSHTAVPSSSSSSSSCELSIISSSNLEVTAIRLFPERMDCFSKAAFSAYEENEREGYRVRERETERERDRERKSVRDEPGKR